jgi:RND family efflux transporter MFP subunit
MGGLRCAPALIRVVKGTEIDAELLKKLRIDGDQREDDGRPAGRGWLLAFAGIAVLAAFAAGWWLHGFAPAPAGAKPSAEAGAGAPAPAKADVTGATAVTPSPPGAGSAILQATGYITARRQATVSAQITGTLVQVLIEEGDHVARGQVLARLEDSALRAALEVAQAQVSSARAQIAQAQAQLAQYEADARRQDDLVAAHMVSPQAAEQARTSVASGVAQLEARRREAEAAAAQLTAAQVNFDYTIVRAPFAGVVTAKAAQVGEIVSPFSAGGGFTRTGVGTIVDMDSLEVDVDVNEAYIRQVVPGMKAEAVLDAYPDWKIPAHVIAIVPAADRGKATIKVRVGFEKKDPRLVPDIGVRVSFLKG